MSCPTSALGAALRACGICPAQPIVRNWVLADRARSSRVAPGLDLQIRLNGVSHTDSLGRHAHIRGIMLRTSARVNVAGATNDPITQYQARSLFDAIFLEDVTGQQFWSSLNMRTLIDDQYFRFGRVVFQPRNPSALAAQSLQAELLAQNAGASDYDLDISTYVPIAPPTDLLGHNPLRNLIPLASLQRRGSDALRIRLGTAFAGAPAGVQLTEYRLVGSTTIGVDVWLDIVYLPGYVVDRPWQVEEYIERDTSGILRHPDRTTEHAHIRYFPEDTSAGSAFSGQELAAAHDGVTLTIAGFTQVSALTTDELRDRMILTASEMVDSAHARGNLFQSLPITSAAGVMEAAMLVPQRPRAEAAAGPIEYNYSSRDADFTRYVHRTVSCPSPQRADQLAQELNMGPCAVFGSKRGGDHKREPDANEPVIVIPTGMSRA